MSGCGKLFSMALMVFLFLVTGTIAQTDIPVEANDFGPLYTAKMRAAAAELQRTGTGPGRRSELWTLLSSELFNYCQKHEEELTRRELLDNYDRGWEFADRAIALDPESAESWYWRAVHIGSEGNLQSVLKALREIDEILLSLEHCLELDPRRADAWAVLARVHAELPAFLGGDKDISVDAARKAVRYAGGKAEIPENQAVLAMALWKRNNEGDRTEARELAAILRIAAGVGDGAADDNDGDAADYQQILKDIRAIR